jgi:hypothetical protein
MIEVIRDEMLDVLSIYPDDYFDLVVTSPPYEDARTYGIGFNLKGQDWVDWALFRYLECVRVCKGLVVWVVEGKTRQFRWSATPALLMADLHRAGVKLRKPPIYHRVGIPGSGGPDWWRNDYEFCVASSKGKLPWSDNTATGMPCGYPPGGAMSNRTQDGQRRNERTGVRLSRGRPVTNIANPGNVIKCSVGGGKLGHKLAHENEAPFPESLVEPFIKCFCPPGGRVLDPFCGSGTTLAVADRLGRDALGIDIRESQTELTRERVGLQAFYDEIGIADGADDPGTAEETRTRTAS